MAQAADGPRLAEARGSLGHDRALRVGSGAPADRSLCRLVCRHRYAGLVPNMLKAVPAVAISYTVFETSKKELIGRGW